MRSDVGILDVEAQEEIALRMNNPNRRNPPALFSQKRRWGPEFPMKCKFDIRGRARKTYLRVRSPELQQS